MVKFTDVSGSQEDDVSILSSFSYEETVAKVEEIVSKIESGKLELAEVFDEFAVAVESLRQCQSFLEQRKQKVDLSIELLEDEGESV